MFNRWRSRSASSSTKVVWNSRDMDVYNFTMASSFGDPSANGPMVSQEFPETHNPFSPMFSARPNAPSTPANDGERSSIPMSATVPELLPPLLPQRSSVDHSEQGSLNKIRTTFPFNPGSPSNCITDISESPEEIPSLWVPLQMMQLLEIYSYHLLKHPLITATFLLWWMLADTQMGLISDKTHPMFFFSDHGFNVKVEDKGSTVYSYGLSCHTPISVWWTTSNIASRNIYDPHWSCGDYCRFSIPSQTMWKVTTGFTSSLFETLIPLSWLPKRSSNSVSKFSIITMNYILTTRNLSTNCMKFNESSIHVFTASPLHYCTIWCRTQFQRSLYGILPHCFIMRWQIVRLSRILFMFVVNFSWIDVFNDWLFLLSAMRSSSRCPSFRHEELYQSTYKLSRVYFVMSFFWKELWTSLLQDMMTWRQFLTLSLSSRRSGKKLNRVSSLPSKRLKFSSRFGCY